MRPVSENVLAFHTDTLQEYCLYSVLFVFLLKMASTLNNENPTYPLLNHDPQHRKEFDFMFCKDFLTGDIFLLKKGKRTKFEVRKEFQ